MFKRFCLLGISLIAALLLLSFDIQAGTPQLKQNQKIYINNELTLLETPIISKNGILYFPIRDIAKGLKGSFLYQRKDDCYYLQTDLLKYDCTVIPNSKEFWIGDTQHFLAVPTFHYENRLYFPIKEFCSLLPLSLKKTSKAISISTTKSKQSQKTKNTNIIASSGDTIPLTDAYFLPILDNDLPIKLSFGKTAYLIMNKFLYQNDLLFVDCLAILKKEGFKFKKENDIITLSKGSYRYSFSTKSTKLTITNGKTITKKQTVHPVLVKNKSYYFPFISLINALDMVPHWSPEKRTIFLLKKIHRVNLKNINDVLSLHVYSFCPFPFSSTNKGKEDSFFFFEIPYSVSALKHQSIPIKHAVVDKIVCKPVSRTSTRVYCYFKKSFPYIRFSAASYGAQITFHNTLAKIKDVRLKDQLYVYFIGKGALKPVVKKSKNKKRLIIDFPNTVCKLPYNNFTKAGLIKNVFASQYKKDPFTTRIVIESTKPISSYKKVYSNDQWAIVLPYKAPKVTGSSLKNKTIFIDAGHGGSDPGAIGIDRDMEKHIVLDIAKRLEKRLIQNGAKVIMSRRHDLNPSLQSRVKNANKKHPHIFVSIHANSFFKPYANGTECYYYKRKDKPLAKAIQSELVKQLGLNNNGVKRARLYVCRHTKMPAVLVEPAFITNPYENRLLKQPSFREKVAISVYKGIVQYFKRK